ncbi:MAG: META domain-containing protein [Candidatus Neomarinimicrobiota bacterium]
MKPARPYFLPAMLLIAMIACSDPEDAIIDADLLEGVWRVDPLITPDSTIVPRWEGPLVIQFGGEMEIEGYYGRHYYQGVYEIPAPGSIEITILSSSADTVQDVSKTSVRFLEALSSVSKYTLRKDTLELFNKGREYVIHASLGLVDEELLGVVWKVDTLLAPDFHLIPGDTLMTVKFYKEYLLVGGGGACNYFAGTFTNTEKGSLNIEVRSVTLMSCGRRPDLLDGYYFWALDSITSYEVSAGRLRLHDYGLRYIISFSVEQTDTNLARIEPYTFSED